MLLITVAKGPEKIGNCLFCKHLQKKFQNVSVECSNLVK